MSPAGRSQGLLCQPEEVRITSCAIAVCYLLLSSRLLSEIRIALEFCLGLGKQYLRLVPCYCTGYIIKDYYMPFCIMRVFNGSLVGRILLSGF